MNLPARPTPEELSEFYWHRAAMPCAAWLALLLAACLDPVLTPPSWPSGDHVAPMWGAVSAASAQAASTAALRTGRMESPGAPEGATCTLIAGQHP
jgi:hypothetical protein